MQKKNETKPNLVCPICLVIYFIDGRRHRIVRVDKKGNVDQSNTFICCLRFPLIFSAERLIKDRMTDQWAIEANSPSNIPYYRFP